MSVRNMLIGSAGARAPDAPTSVSATAGNTTASVSFTAPASNGGSPITQYTVTSSPGGITATGSSSPITVTGLTNDTAYTFTVTATNAIGTSIASSASNSVTPFSIQLSGTYYNSYSALSTDGQSNQPGTARVVLNGYGILFYGWWHGSSTTSMHQITLPSFLLNKVIDMTIIGGGGDHSGGGGGGGAGAGGGRHIGTLTSQTAYIKTGTHRFVNEDLTNVVGSVERRNAEFYVNLSNTWVQLRGLHAGESAGGYSTGCNVYNYRGPNSNGSPSLQDSNSGNLSQVQAVDSGFQYCYAGGGDYLPGFGSPGTRNGSDLGGGGGGHNCTNYGGSCSGFAGGRYGYSGGDEKQPGAGPVGGIAFRNSTYPKGGGGSFGGGVGDAGNNNSYFTGGGGAILIRWDTLAGFGVGFQSGRPGWP